ncbi:MAG: phage virion morphogenesis protein [Gallionella sp.]|nr:phage virion morphogenesis protein [Gallionella sp.]MDD4947586.1 phage virion morphogenesis protein [Gallionella sp.]MDD5613200.1 phage virion morphogenesis protein [Gallionella sp.]
MQFELKFQVDHLNRSLSAVRKAMAHPAELLGSVGETLLRVNRDRHDAGLAPDGSKWKELSLMTLTEKRKGGPLNKTGRMLESFNYQASGDALVLGFDGATESLRATLHNSGTSPYVISAKKAKALKFGGIYRKRVNHPGLPKRQLVGLPDSDRRLVADVTFDYLSVILNRVR